VEAYNMEDPNAITDTSVIRTNTPVSIFKDILGDKNITPTGISDTIRQTSIKDFVDRGDYNYIGLVNWAGLQDVIDSSDLVGLRYTFKIKDDDSAEAVEQIEFDLGQLLQGVALTHEARMVWEWNESIRAHWINFVKEGSDSVAKATVQGRVIPSGDITMSTPSRGTDGGEWRYAGLSATYARGDGGTEVFNVKNRDGRVRHTLKDKALTINDETTLMTAYTPEARERVIQMLTKYQQRFSQINYKHTLPLTLSPYAKIAVGKSCVFDGEVLLDRATGQRGTGEVLGEVRAMTRSLGGVPSLSVDIIVDPVKKQGIGPSMYMDTLIQTNNILAVSGLVSDPANNDFADPGDAVIDGTLTERDCSCGNYAITVFERGADRLYFDSGYTYANQNVWRGTISVTALGIANGECVITLADDNNFSTVNAANGNFVVQFDSRASANLQSCQTELYGWLGRPTSVGGRVIDSSGTEHSPIMIP
jgi:hypothetical protein